MRAAGWTHGGLIATEVPAGKTHVAEVESRWHVSC